MGARALPYYGADGFRGPSDPSGTVRSTMAQPSLDPLDSLPRRTPKASTQLCDGQRRLRLVVRAAPPLKKNGTLPKLRPADVTHVRGRDVGRRRRLVRGLPVALPCVARFSVDSRYGATLTRAPLRAREAEYEPADLHDAPARLRPYVPSALADHHVQTPVRALMRLFFAASEVWVRWSPRRPPAHHQPTATPSRALPHRRPASAPSRPLPRHRPRRGGNRRPLHDSQIEAYAESRGIEMTDAGASGRDPTRFTTCPPRYRELAVFPRPSQPSFTSPLPPRALGPAARGPCTVSDAGSHD